MGTFFVTGNPKNYKLFTLGTGFLLLFI